MIRIHLSRTFHFNKITLLHTLSKWTIRRLKREGIPLLEHIGNSPDMNALEGAWMSMRIAITKDWGASHTLEWTDRAWRGQWDLFPQDKIRALVAKMDAISSLIIEHEGGNELVLFNYNL
jgi:hypothetical protein